MVTVKASLEQITNGTHYKGTVEIGESLFDYELKFGVPIEELDDHDPPPESEGKEAMRKHAQHLLQFSVTKKGQLQAIEMNDALFGFLIGTVGQMAIRFYNNPQTIDSNKGIMGIFIGKRVLEPMGAKVTLSMSTSFEIQDDGIPEVLK